METDSLTGMYTAEAGSEKKRALGGGPEVVVEMGKGSKARGSMGVRHCLRQNLLLLLTSLGILVGLALGLGIRQAHPSRDALMWLGMAGELYLRALKLMILPLIICSVISSSATLDPKSNGRISLVAFIYIVVTNILSCVVAIICCVIINPGSGGGGTGGGEPGQVMQTQDIFADLLRNIVPNNLVKACFSQAQTQYSTEIKEITRNLTNGSIITETITTVAKSVGETGGINVLGLITACLVLGVAANTLGPRAKSFLKFFNAATDVTLVTLRWFLWLTPVGVASLVAVSMGGLSDVGVAFKELGLLVLAVSVGLAIHQLLLLPAIFLLLVRTNPYRYMLNMAKAYFIGLAATSTAVAIPEMITAVEEKENVDRRVARFVIPFSVTINANGSALYITSAAIFLAQYSGHDVTGGDILVIGVLTSVAAMAIPSVPSSSIVTLVIILTSVNIPAHNIALLFAVEWILDRLRTGVNVVSHTYCAGIVYRLCRAHLRSKTVTIDDDVTVVTDDALDKSSLSLTPKFVTNGMSSSTLVSKV